MLWERVHTRADQDVLENIRLRTVRDENWTEYTVPSMWNRSAIDVLCQKVFYKQGIPAETAPLTEENVPTWLWPRTGASPVQTYETDIRDVLKRMAGGWTYRGWKKGIFETEENARIFYDETLFLLLHQMASPDIAQWQNAGLDWAYGLSVPTEAKRAVHETASFDERQPLSGVGILWPKEKSSAGDVQKIKTYAQGLPSAKARSTLTLPVENIGSPSFVVWKKNENIDAMAKRIGLRTLRAASHRVMDACDRNSIFGFDPARHAPLRQAVVEARTFGLTDSAIDRAIAYARDGYEEVPLPAPTDDEETFAALRAVLAVPDSFMETALTGHGFTLNEEGMSAQHYPAQKLLADITDAVWASGEPAISFRDTMTASSVLLGQGLDLVESASGGFVFCPDACAPSAVLNPLKVLQGGWPAFEHAARLMTVVLEIVIDTLPPQPATESYRPLMLGVTNIAAFLMSQGLAYDSEEGRTMASLMTALLTGVALRTSAELAGALGRSAAGLMFEKNMLQLIKDKKTCLSGGAVLPKGMMRRLLVPRTSLCHDKTLVPAALKAWDDAYDLGRKNGFRHAQVTGISTPPDLQALLSDHARDLSPEISLVRFESYFSDVLETVELYGKRLNPMVVTALQKLGYNATQIDDVCFYALGHGTLLDAPGINHETLKARGFHQAALSALEAALKKAQHIRYVFNKWTLGQDFCEHMLGFTAQDLDSGTFDMLAALGFSEDDIDAANVYCCGTMTLEGAPHLLPEHVSIFDCISPAGDQGVRCVSPTAQIDMQAAVELFLTGAATHTVELAHHISIDDTQKLILQAWERGVKTVRLYRQGSSLFDPVMISLDRQAASDSVTLFRKPDVEKEKQIVPQSKLV